jgi:hypothetical protein
MEVESPPIKDAEDLQDSLLTLVDELRRVAGFKIGVDHILRAQELLITLTTTGQLPCDKETLRNYLAAVFCSKPVQQEAFYAHFGSWLSRHPEARALLVTGAAIVETETARRNEAARGELREIMRRGSARGFVLLATIFLILTIAVGFFVVRPKQNLSSRVLDDKGKPVFNAGVEFARASTKTDGQGIFSLTYEKRLGSDDLVVSSDGFDPMRQTLRTDGSAPVTMDDITLSHRQENPVDVPTPTSASTSTATPTPAFTEQDKQSFLDALSKINAAAADPANRVNEPMAGWRKLYVLYYGWARAVAAALPLLCAALWLVWRWYRLLVLKRRTGKLPELDKLRVRGVREQLFASERMRRTSQKYRVHGGAASLDLNAAATIHRTLRRAGLYAPVHGARQMRPEYLILIDRADFADHQAYFFDALRGRLATEGVYLSRYFFDGDPQLCFDEKPGTPPLSLAELVAKHPEDRVMIFSDGAGFMNAISGRPKLTVEKFGPWQHKGLFTPESVPHWGYRERALEEWGFTVLHADEDGLDAFVELIQAGDQVFQAKNARWTPPYPMILKERPARWLESLAPEPAEVDSLREQLIFFLGEDGYYWLSACAAYPAIQWDVTIFLGHRLKGSGNRKLLRHDVLVKLSRLPWFRYGRMPDWLRGRLLDALPTDQHAAVREAVEELLLSHLENPADGISLEYARQREGLTTRERKQLLSDWFRSVSDESPLFDYVFLTFMSGRKPDRLEMALPNAVRRALARYEPRLLGLSPPALVAIAVGLAALLWVMMPPLRPSGDLALIPTFTLEQGLPEAPPRAVSEQPISYYYDALAQYRSESFAALVNGGYFSQKISLDTLQSDTVDGYSLRPAVYQAWLSDTLSRQGITTSAFMMSFLPVNDAERWKTERLYLDSVPTGTIKVVASPSISPSPTNSVAPSPTTSVSPSPTTSVSPSPTTSPTIPAPPQTPVRIAADDVAAQALVRVLLKRSDLVTQLESDPASKTLLVGPSNLYERTLEQLGVSEFNESDFKDDLAEWVNRNTDFHIDTYADNLDEWELTYRVTFKQAVDMLRAEFERSSMIYILYDEANKELAKRIGDALDGPTARGVKLAVSYQLARPQGMLTFRPESSVVEPYSIIFFGDYDERIENQVRELVGSRLRVHTEPPVAVKEDAYFATFVRLKHIKIHISLLSNGAWRGPIGRDVGRPAPQ